MIGIRTPKNLRHYIVHWTWAEGETDEDKRARATNEAIVAYQQMLKNKVEDDPILADLLSKVYKHLESRDLTKNRMPTSLGSSGGGSPNWHTIFWATEDQLKNWFDHYKDVLQIKQIRPIMTADDFVDAWGQGKITWRYWHDR